MEINVEQNFGYILQTFFYVAQNKESHTCLEQQGELKSTDIPLNIDIYY